MLRKKKRRIKRRPWYKRPPAVLTFGLTLSVLIFLIVHFSKRPKLDRNWGEYAERIPHAEVEGSVVTIHNFRDFRWAPGPERKIEEANYLEKTVDLDRLERVWFLKEDFPDFDGFAHTFLSFEFEGGEYVCLSVEARREAGETYSGFQGLWRKYELMYLAGTEQDFIGRRLYVQDADIYLYPVEISPDNARSLFLSMIERMNKLTKEPEFYNSLYSNCTNNLYRHAEETTGVHIPVTWNTVLTGYSDKTAYEMGIIPNDLPFEANRRKYKIDRSVTSLEDPQFSEKIRE